MDMNYGDDLYDSFVSYQGALIEQFDEMARSYNNFVTLDAREEPKVTQQRLRAAVAAYLENGVAAGERAGR
jgi:hypothetical protein